MATFTLQRNDQPLGDDERAVILANPGFGDHFTDHMALATWTQGQGWHDQVLTAVKPLQMHPSAAVLHYGQEIFEGLKAYRHEDGSIHLFRPDRNAARFAQSADRLGMPELPVDDFVESCRDLVALDQNWVPQAPLALYLRPFMVATESLIGVRSAHEYAYMVLATPAGSYYNSPVTLWLTPNFTRATRGGTGAAKCGGNYAASLAAADEAHEHGCDQVMWLDGEEHRWLEECGTMNVMFVTADGELLTPSLESGSILAGVTRDSILQLASEHGLKPVERRIDKDELRTRLTDGTITEAFACGTAAVVTPIIGFKAPDQDDLVVGDGTVGAKTTEIHDHLVDIQFGRAADTHGWLVRVV